MINISDNEIHVWNNSLFSREIDYSILTNQELYYAEKYPTSEQRKKYYYTRCLLKQILSKYIGISAEDISFVHNPNGKPYLCCDKNIYFNLSHTNEKFCLAIGCTDEIGIDIEAKPESHTMQELMDYFLTEAEQSNVINEFPDNLEHKLLRMWTQKEAITKALGLTLDSSLKHICLNNTDDNFVFNYNDVDIHVKELQLDEKTFGTIATRHPVSTFKMFSEDDIDSLKSIILPEKSREYRTSL